jgi:phage shock protein C
MYCSHCGRPIETDARYCAGCGVALHFVAAEPRRVLLRPREGRMIGGVCAGFANCYGWDVTLVRVVAALLVFFSAGSAALAYFALWVLVPEARFALPERATGSAA